MARQTDTRGPAELVAIVHAAHAVGDRDLERSAKRELLARHGIEVKFRRQPKREATGC